VPTDPQLLPAPRKHFLLLLSAAVRLHQQPPATPGETHTCSSSFHSDPAPAPASTTTAAVSPHHSGAVSSSSPQRWQQQPTARSLSTDPPLPSGSTDRPTPSTPALQGHTVASHLAVSLNLSPQTSSSMVQRPTT